MADLAQLGLEIDTRQVDTASASLDKLASSGAKAESAADALIRAAAELSKAAGAIESGMSRATSALTQQSAAAKQVETTMGAAAKRMADFASEAQALQRVQRYMDDIATRAANLRRAVDPMVGVQERYNAALEEASRLYRVGAISAQTYQRAITQARQGYQAAGAPTGQVDQAAINRTLGVRADNSGAGSARESAEAFEEAAFQQEQMADAAARLKAQIDPLGAAQDRLNAELAEYRSLADAGYISTGQLAQATSLAQDRFDRTSASLGAAQNSFRLTSHEVTNVGMQLNDLGVQLASGSSPFMAIIQQGAQVAQTVGPAGTVGNALRALGPALVQFLTNPINLSIVALAGAALAAEKLFSYLTGEGKDASDILREQSEIVGRMRERYGDLADAARNYAGESITILRYSARQQAKELEKAADESFAAVRQKLRGGSDFLSDFLPSNLLGRSYDQEVAPFIDALDRAQEAAKNGQRDLTGFIEEVIRLGQASDNPAVQEMTKALASLSEEGMEAEKAIGEIKRQLQQTTPEALRFSRALQVQKDNWEDFIGMLPEGRTELQQIEDAYRNFLETAQSMGQVAAATERYNQAIRALGQESRDALSEADFGARTAGMRDYERGLAEIRERFMQMREDATLGGTGITKEIDANLKAAQALEERAFKEEQIEGPIRAATDALNEQVAALNIQAGAMGASFREIDRATAAQELINQYMQAGIPITDELAGKIADLAENTAKANEATRALQVGQDLLFERAQMFRTPQEREIAERLRGAQIDIDSQAGQNLAGIMRQNQALEKTIEHLDDIRDSANDAFGTVLDGIRSGADAGDIFADVLSGIADEFAEVAKNSLTDALFGQSGSLDGGILGNMLGLPSALGGAVEKGTLANPMVVTIAGGGLGGLLGGLGGQGAPGGGGLLGGLLGAPTGGTAGSTTAAGAIGNSVAAQTWNYFAQKGLPPQSVAAIVGNMMAESGGRPGAVGDGGTSFGLFQHHAGRGQGLLNAVGGREGLSNVQGQLDYVWNELQTSERRTLNALMSARDTREATGAFVGFERPQGWSPGNPEGAHNFEGRLAGAEQALSEFQSKVDSATTNLGNFGNTIDDVVSGGNRMAGGIGNGISFGQYSPSMFGGGGNYGVALGPNGPVMTDGFTQQAQGVADGFLSGLGGAFSTILGGLGQVGQGFLSGFGSIFSAIINGLGSIGGGGGGGGGFLGGIFSAIGGLFGGGGGGGLTGIGGLYASGGHVRGPGSGISDSIVARISNGEFIVNAASTSKHLPLLHAINDNRYAGGGYVGQDPGMRASGRGAPESLHITVGTKIDKEGNIRPFVVDTVRTEARPVAEEVSTGTIAQYDSNLPGRLQNKRQRGARI